MALIAMDGFDKYGVTTTGTGPPTGLSAMFAGEWTFSGNTLIQDGLTGTGYAVSISSTSLTKNLPASYGRLIGGVRFQPTSLTNNLGIQFSDAGTVQCSVLINPTVGTFSVKNGTYNAGTVLGTSTASILNNSIHYLEWDFTFGNAGSYQLWLDGVSILSGTGDTTTTANNTADRFSFISNVSTIIWDDFYLFDATGTTNNAPLLTNPRVETQFPTGNGAVQFALGAAVVASSASHYSTTHIVAANELRLKSVTPLVGCTLNSISVMPAATTPALNIRPAVYADSSGAPGALLGSGATVTGVTSGVVKTVPLTSGITLVAGTRYWIGLMIDVAATWNVFTDTPGDQIATVTFASGAPSTAPAMTTSSRSDLLWGNVTGAPNWYAVGQLPSQGNQSYVYDAIVGHEDLYTYPPLSVTPAAIYAVAVKASVAKSDVAAKTASVRLKSGVTDSAGTLGTFSPTTAYAWYTSQHITDPNTGAPWALAALNAAQAGLRIES